MERDDWLKMHIKKKKALRIICAIFLILICVLIGLGLYNKLVVVEYDYTNSKIPESFDGYKIVFLTDFHCKNFGDKEEKLIKLIDSQNPDMICLTGDFVDEDHPIDNFENLISGIYNIAPVYYITGNHEYRDGAPYEEMKYILSQYGVCYLNNETVSIYNGNDCIKLTGLDYKCYKTKINSEVGNANTDYFNILLFHNSNEFDWISYYGYDLMLSGHVHGGIIRLPIVGGVLGNDGNLFPKYDYGMYEENGSTMIASSGLGDAFIPRFNNPREVVTITLHSQ